MVFFFFFLNTTVLSLRIFKLVSKPISNFEVQNQVLISVSEKNYQFGKVLIHQNYEFT